MDFGIARFFAGPQVGGERLTRVGEYLGTPRFVAPERVRGGADDGRSDVYSLGAVLFELICGDSPWAEDQEPVAGARRPPRPLPMHLFRPGVPAALEELVARALSADPADRPTAEDFASELCALAPALADSPAGIRGRRTAGFDPTSPQPAEVWRD